MYPLQIYKYATALNTKTVVIFIESYLSLVETVTIANTYKQ